jgi:hypothetical protein
VDKLATLALVACAAIGFGCSSESGEEPTSGTSSGVGGAAPHGCAPSEASLGDACEPPGVPESACGNGFVADGARGCTALLPARPCAGGLVALPGEEACREIAPCGDAPWGEAPLGPETTFVDGAFAGVPDGSSDAPWPTIQQGIDAAEDGGVVAIAAGTYTEDTEIVDKRITLWGRCPSMVALQTAGTKPGCLAVVYAGASGTVVRGLSIRGDAGGSAVSGAEDVLLRDMRFHDLQQTALFASDELGTTALSLDNVHFDHVREFGVQVRGVRLDIDGASFRDVEATAAGEYGRAINIEDRPSSGRRSEATIARVVVERATEVGIFVAGSDALIEHVLVRETRPRASDGSNGRGIGLEDNTDSGERAHAEVRASVLERNHDVGLFAAGADLLVDAVVVRDTLPRQVDSQSGRGIDLEAATDTGQRVFATITRSLIERSRELGVYVNGSEVTLESVLVRETLEQTSNLVAGRGLNVQDSAAGERSSLVMRWSLVDLSRDIGLFVANSDVLVESSLVRSTAPQPADGLYGDGVAVWASGAPASFTGVGLRVEGSGRAGVSSFGGGVALERCQLECNQIALSAQDLGTSPATFEDRGGNDCGCAGTQSPCVAENAALQPPQPIPP